MILSYFNIFRRTLTVKRETNKEFDNELQDYISGVATSFEIKASVQPIPAEKMELLPEGYRSMNGKILYTDTELVVSKVATSQPDVVVIDGKDYVVIEVSKWQNNVINHYRVLVVEKDRMNGG